MRLADFSRTSPRPNLKIRFSPAPSPCDKKGYGGKWWGGLTALLPNRKRMLFPSFRNFSLASGLNMFGVFWAEPSHKSS